MRLHRPKDLTEMMDVALLAEEKIGAVGRFGGQNKQSWGNKGYGNKNWRQDNALKVNTEPATVSTSTKGQELMKTSQLSGAKSIGGKEIEERRKKGLCLTCEEKFTPGHVCKNKWLRLLYIEEAQEGDNIEQKEEEEIVWEANLKSLNLQSMAGLTSKSSFMMRARLGDIEVIVLVDCGARHNFISVKLVAARKLMVEDTPPCSVKVGNGKRILTRGVCRGVELIIQGMTVRVDCYVFPLEGAYMVLGIDW